MFPHGSPLVRGFADGARHRRVEQESDGQMTQTHSLRLAAVALLLAAVTSCGGDSSSGPPRQKSAAEVEIVSGNGQRGAVGTELAQPLVVKVVDANGGPVAGQVVNFVVTSGGGHVFAGSGASNSSGIVQERWTLGTSIAQPQRLEARAVDNNTGAPIVFGTFTATALAGAPHDVVVASGDAQTGPAGTAATDSLAAKVLDQYGNPVAGATVQWAVAAGAGTVSPASGTSDSTGVARTRLTLGTRPGANAVTATVAGIAAATFRATAVAGAPASLVIVSGDAQTGVVGSYLANPLTVRALDAFGNPVAGAAVTWGAATGAGTFDAATATTDASGLASSRWALGQHPGAVSATASVAGAGAVSFSATATVGAAASLVAISGDGQRAVVGTHAPDSLVVKLTDSYANPVAGATVHWATTTNGAQLRPADALTNAQGLAATQLTVSATSGSNAVTATVGGLAAVGFTATGMADVAATIEASGGSAKSGAVGSTVTLAVKALDAYGNAASGAVVEWTVKGGGGSFVQPVTTSGPDGFATATWVLGTQAGSNSATARLGAGSVVIFTADATAGPVDVLQKVWGDAQSAVVPTALPESLVVRAVDQFGNVVPGASITWDGGSHGSVSPVNTTTDAQGLARTQWTLATAGPASATARDASGRSAVFTATGSSSAAPALIIVSGNGQTDIAGEYLQALVVQLNDGQQQPVAGAPVTWKASSNIDYPISASAYTDATGRASATVKLPVAAGTLTVTATSGSATAAVFSAAGVAGPWCSTHVVLDGPATAPAGGNVTVLLQETDWAGNPATGASVGSRLSVSDGGAVVWRDSIPGLRVGTWTLGSTIGTQTLSYQYTFCGGFSPKSGFPRSGSAYDVINVNVVAPSP
jgi:protocatechuate 3,4-dioxygenase beta subunit